jgi:hypothetical protein
MQVTIVLHLTELVTPTLHTILALIIQTAKNIIAKHFCSPSPLLNGVQDVVATLCNKRGSL